MLQWWLLWLKLELLELFFVAEAVADVAAVAAVVDAAVLGV